MSLPWPEPWKIISLLCMKWAGSFEKTFLFKQKWLCICFLCPKIPQKRLVSAFGTLFWPLATTHTNLLQLSWEFRWSHPARPEEAQWKVKEWKRIPLDITALKNTHLHLYLGETSHMFTLPDQTCSWYIWTVSNSCLYSLSEICDDKDVGFTV